MGNTPRTKKKTTKTPTVQQAKPAPSQLWRRVGIGAGVALVIGFAVWMALGDAERVAGVPDGTREIDVEGALHVEGEIYEDDAQVSAGGDHNATWLNCGVYDEEVPEEFAVHSLEHGAVWITYRPEIDDQAAATLRSVASSRQKVIVSPEPSQDVAFRATAWGFQLDLDDADDSRLRQFVNEFEGSPEAPEPGGLCTNGVGTPS